MDPNTFGWELLMESVREDSPSKRDILVVLVHWYLLKMKSTCLGVGNEKTLSPHEKGSETLPEGWNKSETYSLRYRFKNNLFLMHATECGDALLVSLLDASDLSSSNVAIDIEKTVEKVEGKLPDMIPSYNDLINKFDSTLFKTFSNKVNKDTEVQTDISIKKSESTKPESPNVPSPGNIGQRSQRDVNFPNIGGSDLNPFGVGGGMIFDPLRRQPGRPQNPWDGGVGGLPRGSVPPGARFDPFFPPTGGRNNPRGAPDADHLRPPDYDDMFS